MKTLRSDEQVYLKKMFINGCNVLDLSAYDLRDFAKPFIKIDLMRKYRGFAATIFLSYLREEAAEKVIVLIEELLNYAIAKDIFFEQINFEMVKKCRNIIEKYKKTISLSNFSIEFNSDYIDKMERDMFNNIKENPTLAIGQAKEFIESSCKYILESKGVEINKKWDLNDLTRESMQKLELLPKQVEDQEEGCENIKAILGNLKAITNNLSQLRNSYGTGHGKNKNFISLDSSHAKLAVGSAITFVNFIYDVYQNQGKIEL